MQIPFWLDQIRETQPQKVTAHTGTAPRILALTLIHRRRERICSVSLQMSVFVMIRETEKQAAVSPDSQVINIPLPTGSALNAYKVQHGYPTSPKASERLSPAGVKESIHL